MKYIIVQKENSFYLLDKVCFNTYDFNFELNSAPGRSGGYTPLPP